MTGAGRDINLQMGLKFSEENLHWSCLWFCFSIFCLCFCCL